MQSHLGPARRVVDARRAAALAALVSRSATWRCSPREPIAIVARAIQTRREAADEGDRIA